MSIQEEEIQHLRETNADISRKLARLQQELEGPRQVSGALALKENTARVSRRARALLRLVTADTSGRRACGLRCSSPLLAGPSGVLQFGSVPTPAVGWCRPPSQGSVPQHCPPPDLARKFRAPRASD